MDPRNKNQIRGGLWGALIGDALGVPVEFSRREELAKDPVKDFRGHGVWSQPKGTWSDDGALTLATMNALVVDDFVPTSMGIEFVRWWLHGEYTATGEMFDIGNTTRSSLNRFAKGATSVEAGGTDESDNGNGSLMRILPVAIYCAKLPLAKFTDNVMAASAITHGHPRAKMACVFYSLLVRNLLNNEYDEFGVGMSEAYVWAVRDFKALPWGQQYLAEMSHFERLLKLYGEGEPDGPYGPDLEFAPSTEIRSGGYVMDTLEAAVWCLYGESTYKDSVLRAVNLGGDTDTTGIVTGGLAGVLYGINAVPKRWRNGLQRAGYAQSMIEEFVEAVAERWDIDTKGE